MRSDCKTRNRTIRIATLGNEWFEADSIIHFLREAEWLGNAGNLSQIAQVLPVANVAGEPPTSRATASDPERRRKPNRSPEAVKHQGYIPAPEVFWH